MKFVNTIVFSVVLLQQIMNLGVQADTPCTKRGAINLCNNFKKTGQLCECSTQTEETPFGPAIVPSVCEKATTSTDPKDKKCTSEYMTCQLFCNASGKSCSITNGCVAI